MRAYGPTSAQVGAVSTAALLIPPVFWGVLGGVLGGVAGTVTGHRLAGYGFVLGGAVGAYKAYRLATRLPEIQQQVAVARQRGIT